MALEPKDVAHIARLARIRVPAEELGGLVGELRAILDWVEQLSEVDTTGVAPMTSVVEARLKQRADEVTDGGDPAPILANAPAGEGDYFVVPKVIE